MQDIHLRLIMLAKRLDDDGQYVNSDIVLAAADEISDLRQEILRLTEILDNKA